MPYDSNYPNYLATQYEYGSAGGADMNKLQKDIDHEIGRATRRSPSGQA